MNNLDHQYKALLKDILENGHKKSDRTGTGTISVFGRTVRHKMSEGFPLLTTKRMAWKQIAIELMWFLRGSTNIEFLVKNNCHIWDGDAYKKYLKFVDTMDPEDGTFQMVEESGTRPLNISEFADMIKHDAEFAEKFGDLGPIYGKQWKNWTRHWYEDTEESIASGGYIAPSSHTDHFDQISELIETLKTDPDSRRMLVSAWNVGEIAEMTLPPCHFAFQVYTRELSIEERMDLFEKKHPELDRHDELMLDPAHIPSRAISLKWYQRSCDVFLGLPFNIASYGLLLTMLADEVNMVPEELIGDLGDTHLYSNHLEQAKEQMSRTAYPLPRVHVRDGMYSSSINDFVLIDYKSQSSISAPLSN